MSKDKKVMFRAEEDLWEKLERVAKDEDITVSHLLRRISIAKVKEWEKLNERSK